MSVSNPHLIDDGRVCVIAETPPPQKKKKEEKKKKKKKLECKYRHMSALAPVMTVMLPSLHGVLHLGPHVCSQKSIFKSNEKIGWRRASVLLWKATLSPTEVVTKWMGDRYVLELS